MRRPLVRSVALAASAALTLGALVALAGGAGAATTSTRVALNVHPHDQLGAARPGIDVYSGATPCAVSAGTFVIRHIAFTAGAVSALDLSFVRECGTPDAPPALPDHQPPGLTVAASGGLGSVRVTYAVTGTELLAPVVRASYGTTAPATATDGFAVPVTGAGVATIGGLTVGAAVSARVFVEDTGGYAATATAVLQASTARVSVADTSLTYGQATTVTGAMSTDGAHPVPGATVLVQTRRHGTAAWHTSATLTTGAAGTARPTGFRPSVGTDVRTITSKPAAFVSAVSAVRVVVVRPVVSLKASRSTVKKAKTVTFTGSVRQPAAARGSVVLQRWSGGKWRTVATRSLSTSRTYSIAVKQRARGTFKFRVYRSAAGGRAGAVSPVRVVKVR